MPGPSRRYLMRALNRLPKISSCRTAPVSRSSHTRRRPPKLTRLRDGPASSGGKSSADLKSGGGDASSERCDEIFRGERQTENLCDRLGVGRPDMSLVLHGVVRSQTALVNGHEQERRAEWRERFEADRARRLDEKNAAETLALAPPGQGDVGESAQVGEFARTIREERECSASVLAAGLLGRHRRACGAERKQQEEEETTERPLGHP